MDEETSIVLLKDLLLVRPFACSLQSFMEGSINHAYRIDVFVIKGTTVKGQAIRAKSAISFIHIATFFPGRPTPLPYFDNSDEDSDEDGG